MLVGACPAEVTWYSSMLRGVAGALDSSATWTAFRSWPWAADDTCQIPDQGGDGDISLSLSLSPRLTPSPGEAVPAFP